MPARFARNSWVKPLATMPILECGPVCRALSPKTREKAVADQDDVGWPFGMLRE
jgi:hypothetical protein